MQTEMAVVEPVVAGMENIADKLAELQSGAAHLKHIYGVYAEASDLTFIKILEERYELLEREIEAIGRIVDEIQTDCGQPAAEAIHHGG